MHGLAAVSTLLAMGITSAYHRAFAENLVVLRKMASFTTQGDLAAALGDKPSARTIGRWERGERLPDAYEISRLAVVLGCTADELVTPRPLSEDERKLLRQGAIAVDLGRLRAREAV